MFKLPASVKIEGVGGDIKVKYGDNLKWEFNFK